jgi:hypothetical protein
MKRVLVVVAKIRPEIYGLIESGRKRFEVRLDDFGHETDVDYLACGAIVYVDASTGEELGVWEVDDTGDWLCCGTDEGNCLDANALEMLDRSAVGEEVFRELFHLDKPAVVVVLNSVRLKRRITSLAQITEEEK